MAGVQTEPKAQEVKIVSRWDSRKVLAVGETVLKALVAAAAQGAYLQGADLRGADLRGAYLRGAYLQGAYLQGADLRGAYLQGADLQGADLQGADLRGAIIGWTIHHLIAEILFRAAGDDIGKRMIAGLILVSTDWCWNEFTKIESDHRTWALTELAKWIQPNDSHPAILDAYVAQPESTIEEAELTEVEA